MRTASVVIPTWNCAPRLVRALDSVAAQTCAPGMLEIIVVDDGSTDDTAACVAEFAARSPFPVRYAHQQNAGPAAARNHGMRLARGAAIAFLDADDAWLPRKLERQLPLLGGRVGLVYCDNSWVDANGNALAGYVRRVQLHRGDALAALFCDFFLLSSAVVIDRAAIAECGEFDEGLPVGEDYEYFLRIARRRHIDHVAEPLLVRCVRPDSLSRRDYALDARTDLGTLTAFLRDNPGFARRHGRRARRRIADYRYGFAWRLLADGRRREAIGELLRSLRGAPSLRAARTLARAMLFSTSAPVAETSRAPG